MFSSLKPLLRRGLHYAEACLLIGNRYECPLCGGRFRAFLSAGVQRRPNVSCPRCQSLERHRLLYLFLQEKTSLFSGPGKVLHIAPEPVLTKVMYANPHIEYVSGDLGSPLAMVKLDVTQLPFADGAFDYVIANHVLEHIPDDAAAMRELRRVLKPTGWAVLQSPVDMQLEKTDEDPRVTDPRERERRFGQSDHVRQYGRDYVSRLRQAGFAVQVDPFVRQLPPNVRERYRLAADEDIYFCRKADVAS